MRGALQLPILVLEFEQLEGAIDHQQEDVGIDRLGEEIVGTQSNGSDSVLSVLATGDDNLGSGLLRENGLKQR